MPKFRIPRKQKKKIPKGMYCYTFLKFHDDGLGYAIKPCEFYKHLPDSYLYGKCSLLKCEIDDQCKSCGTKYDF